MNQIEKVILLGDTATGKSSFLKNYITGTRTRVSLPTSSFECLTAMSPGCYLQIWDTPGKQKYRLMPMSIIHQYGWILIFYDLTNRHTFQVARDIIDNIRKYNNTAKIGLVGNKMDLVMQNPLKRQVEEAEAAAYARQQGIFLTEFSFQQRADKLLQKFMEFKREDRPQNETTLQKAAQQSCRCV